MAEVIAIVCVVWLAASVLIPFIIGKFIAKGMGTEHKETE